MYAQIFWLCFLAVIDVSNVSINKGPIMPADSSEIALVQRKCSMACLTYYERSGRPLLSKFQRVSRLHKVSWFFSFQHVHAFIVKNVTRYKVLGIQFTLVYQCFVTYLDTSPELECNQGILSTQSTSGQSQHIDYLQLNLQQIEFLLIYMQNLQQRTLEGF